MATNKFATMLHRNTHKITVILVYAVLEWLLIIFLLLNSLFTFLIRKFAAYFGLKPPCVWCSRVDHILEPDKSTKCYRDLVCESHASEISKLSYCSNHRRLTKTQNMCTECLASPPQENEDSIRMTTRIAFHSWVNAHKIEHNNQDSKCSCCNESLESKIYPTYLVFKSSWDALDYTQKERLIIEAIDNGKNRGVCEEQRKPDSLTNHDENDNEIGTNDGEECHTEKDAADEFPVISDVDSFGGLTEIAEENCSRSVSNLQHEEQEVHEEEAGKSSAYNSSDNTVIRCCSGEDDSLEIINLGSERNVDCGATRMIPIGLIDSLTNENKRFCNPKEELLKARDPENEAFCSALQSETQANILGQSELIGIDESTENTRYGQFDRSESDCDAEIENPSVLKAEEETQDLVGDACTQFSTNQADQSLSIDGNEVGAETLNEKERTKGSIILVDQTKSKNLTSIEAVDGTASHPQAQEPIFSLPCLQEDQSSTNNNDAEVINISKVCMVPNDLGQKQQETGIVGEILNLVAKNQEGINYNSSTRSELNEAEEEKFLDTPTSLDNFHYLHKKLLLFEKRELGMEESLDGSVASEMEGIDPVLSIERLKSALKAQRKALSALYSELEEERSASAVAANQTMAMITRLQEEKAAMQMEALQYQRMMEEQAEYDQEALQLLNELMVKREKEKQELEKELEKYRKKVLDYEEKEKMRMMRRGINGSVRSRNSSTSCSNSGDTDELSIDLNREVKDEDSSFCDHQEVRSDNTPAGGVLKLEEMALDCIKHITALDDSLSEFEEERLSILDQLKVLEEKLLTLGDNEFNEDFKSIEQSPKFSVNEFDKNEFSSTGENGFSNGFSKDRLNPDRISMASMARGLLPLLDATANETEQGLIHEEQVEFETVEMKNSSVSAFDLDSKRLAIEEEVDRIYDSLHSLEVDREFVKHCMSSVNNKDKGMDLLQDILQHLHDLRAAEIISKSMSDDNTLE